MSATAGDVLLVEGLVEGDGLAEVLDGVGDAVLEAAAPELVLLGRFHRRGDGGGGAEETEAAWWEAEG